MNPHLFLDVMAMWTFGALFFAGAIRFGLGGWGKKTAKRVLWGILLATLCWAWVIAG